MVWDKLGKVALSESGILELFKKDPLVHIFRDSNGEYSLPSRFSDVEEVGEPLKIKYFNPKGVMNGIGNHKFENNVNAFYLDRTSKEIGDYESTISVQPLRII